MAAPAPVYGPTFRGFYDFYEAGQFNGHGPVCWMIRYFKRDGSFGSCSLVEESKAAAELAAVRGLGYLPLRKLTHPR